MCIMWSDSEGKYLKISINFKFPLSFAIGSGLIITFIPFWKLTSQPACTLAVLIPSSVYTDWLCLPSNLQINLVFSGPLTL